MKDLMLEVAHALGADVSDKMHRRIALLAATALVARYVDDDDSQTADAVNALQKELSKIPKPPEPELTTEVGVAEPATATGMGDQEGVTDAV